MKRNIAIIYGGRSVEHDISILTFLQVVRAIDTSKYNVIPIYLDKDNNFYVGEKFTEINTYKNTNFKKHQINLCKKNNDVYINCVNPIYNLKYKVKIELAVVAVHGKGLEDGTLEGYLNILNLPNTSSSVVDAGIFQNKYYTKVVLEKEKIKVLPYINVYEEEYLLDKEKVNKKLEAFNFPVIIKACDLGSSIGIEIATKDNFDEKIIKVFEYESRVIIEECLTNFIEYNQAFYYKKNRLQISEIEEIRKSDVILSFDDKYLDSSPQRTISPKISNNLKKKINFTTRKIAKIFRPKGVIRIDYLYDELTSKLYVNEINSIPGSFAFYLFEDKQIKFEDLVEDLINEADLYKFQENEKINSFKSNVIYEAKSIKK